VSGPRRRKSSGSQPRGRRRAPQRDFWGNADAFAEPATRIVPAEDPTVMLHSLSSPPLPGRETVAVHYFAAVAEKAASLAVALAAASDLLDWGDDRSDDEGDDLDEFDEFDEYDEDELSPEPA
jgi:hypothetical protein